MIGEHNLDAPMETESAFPSPIRPESLEEIQNGLVRDARRIAVLVRFLKQQSQHTILTLDFEELLELDSLCDLLEPEFVSSRSLL